MSRVMAALLFVSVHFAAALEPLQLHRLLFRALYSLGRTFIFESSQSNLNPTDSRADYDFVPISPANMRGFLSGLSLLYPNCKSVSTGFHKFINGADLNFSCTGARTTDTDTVCRKQPNLQQKYSVYAHAALWAANCQTFPPGFERKIPDDVASIIMMDGCWLGFEQRLHWPDKRKNKTSVRKLPLNFDDLLKLDPELYRCSENTGHAFWSLLHAVTISLKDTNGLSSPPAQRSDASPLMPQSSEAGELVVWKKMISHFIPGVYPVRGRQTVDF